MSAARLEFTCCSCQKPVRFSAKDLSGQRPIIVCPECEKKYLFDDPTLNRQIHKFEALCNQIRDSEEILGNTTVGVDVGDRHVNIPYKLLLARLTTKLSLNLAGQPLNLTFRVEPTVS
ncbi:MAG: hypothetical protein KDK65_03090 [Chlamydiia bacterium]|nr:hypothetical protein [Chlamydiia bacterium]